MACPVTEPLAPEGVARAHRVAAAIDEYVAADVTIAASAVGMGADALASALRTRAAETYADLAPWVALAADVMAYIETGAVGPVMADRFGHLLTDDTDPA